MQETNLETYERAEKDYINELLHKGFSKCTIRSYSNPIRYFKEWKTENSGWENQPSIIDMRGWRDSLLDSGTSAKTVRYYLGVMKGFFEFTNDEDLGEDAYFTGRNPVSEKIYPVLKQTDKERNYEKVLSGEDLKKLWCNQKPAGTDKLWARNYAIVTLLLDGKIRNAELLDLKLSDIHFATEEEPFNDLLVRHGKGDKARYVTLTGISVSALKLYLASGIRPADLSDDDYLFGTTSSHEFGGSRKSGVEPWHRGTSQWLSKLVEKHVKDVTGKSGFRSHSLRHNGAIMDLNSGASMERIQAELGHSSIQTTEIYAGRLMPTRRAKDMQDVYAVRDEWAERNMKKLARM